ncbi:hypothetical protein [Ferrovibrio terrae]|uniref:hypothetical protein n=1 Tax=Ferrovibrio terrae TaxID=2594003 RepID=UPI003137A2A4
MTIAAVDVTVDRNQARDLYRQYKAHQHYSAPIDMEIQRAYQLIAQGRTVIRALESVKLAGVDAAGLPKLAIIRADAAQCWLDLWTDGSARFAMERWPRSQSSRTVVQLQRDTFPRRTSHHNNAVAKVPLIPVHLRPKRALESYHILWEAEWAPVPPVDPLLLRRIGKADLWLVCAAWDLTPVEQAALATRIAG